MAPPHALRCVAVVVRKNFVLKGRGWAATLLELLLPVALMLLIVWIRTEIHREDVPAQSYIASPENNPTWFGAEARNLSQDFGPVAGLLEGFCRGGPTGLCPELYAEATWTRRKEHYLGVALDGLLLLHMSLHHQQLGVVGSPALAAFIEGIPGYSFGEGAARRSFVRHFGTQAEADAYLRGRSYGFSEDVPQLFGLINVKSEAVRNADGTFSGDWDAVIHLNATGPGSVDINGATDINTKLKPPTTSFSNELRMGDTRIYWSGGLFASTGVPLTTGGFVDLQSLLYAWILNSTGALSLPSPDRIPKCECTDTATGEQTEDFRRCRQEEVLLKVLMPQWPYAGTLPDALPAGTPRGCLGRVSGLLPISVREVPMPTPAHTKDDFALIVEGVFGLFFTLLFLWPLTRMMKCLTEDKEARINEMMKMMGLPAEAITLGWYVTYAILWLLPAGLITGIAWTTVFEHSNKTIVALFFWLFGLCVLAFCSLLAVFFERAKTASVVGALVFFLLIFPYNFVMGSSTTTAAKTLASLCPPVALSFGAGIIAKLESAGSGVQWDTLDEDIDGFTMGRVLTMLAVDIGLFAVLAWYLDKVLVVGFGTRQPWYFCCLRRYWRRDRSGLGDEEVRDLEGAFDDLAPENPRYQAVDADLAATRSVLLRGLKKFFKTEDGQMLAAVQGLSVNLYPSQIFCLLGHNGAGKTTTINMLSGMLPVDEGDAIMYGRSVRKDMPSIRKILGVCPQHDVIWAQLTVREHLEFFAAVKGVPPGEISEHVRSIIADVSLQEKQGSLARTLSGGQKRRLSAAISLIGGSKVVFLDEPSSGVDPFSRRELWDCLKAKKVGRTIIMTTHFMDEAEELGDRIAIMAAGQIKCVGSSLFLKAQYGVGYTVTITRRPEALAGGAQTTALRALVASTCPESQVVSEVGAELVYRMPMSESRAFPALFEKFESSPEELGVDFFGVSVTTLEEVFLRVGQDHAEADQTVEQRWEARSFTRQLSRQTSGGSAEGGAPAVAALPAAALPAAAPAVASAGAPPRSTAGRSQAMEAMRAPLAGEGLVEEDARRSEFLRHLHALLAKRYNNAKRDRKAWCCQVVVPLIFLLFSLLSLKFANVGAYDDTLVGLDALPSGQTLPYAADPSDAADAERFLKGLSGGVHLEEVQGASSDVDFDRYLLKTFHRGGRSPRFGAFRFQSVPRWGGDAERIVGGWRVSGYKQPGLVLPTGVKERQLWPGGFTVPVGVLWNETDRVPTGHGAQPIDVRMSELNNRLQVDLFWNSSARDAIPIFYHTLHTQYLRTSLGPEKLQGSTVKVSNQPFPLTMAQKDLTDTQTSLFLALGFAFIPVSYGAFVVLERENNSKHLQIVSGVNFVSYWLATWLWDVINYLVPAVLSVAMIAAFGIDTLVSGTNLFWTALVVLMYGVSCTSFTYMFTFLFQSHTSAQNLLLVMYLFTGGILEIVSIVLQIIPNTQNLMRNVLIFVFRLMPNFCFADALTNMITRTNPLATLTYNCPMSGCDPWHLNILGWDLIYMGVGSIVWFLVTLALELALNTPRFRAMFQRGPSVAETADDRPVDNDVRAETERVLSGAADVEMVVVRGLRKVFAGRAGAPPKVALKGVHFAIPEGQCFGYLGMNGAGKTTTMKILTGEELSTSGGATLGGFDIATQQGKVRQLLGYCPQFDALTATLTAREHLTLFARIKGVAAARIPGYVEAMLDWLTLTPYADRQAGTFSGGTKRKLSLGIALIGDPRIVFLDEPTTGVDPESRRFLWSLISATMQGRSAILTTHSMDECEALCGRIGIMVNGELVCLGTASHLKAVHGAGYQFDVSFRAGADLKAAFDGLVEFAKTAFAEGAHIAEGTRGSAHVKLRLPKTGSAISAIFRSVEEQRERLAIAEYSVSETTLEQIFINFARHQEGAEVVGALPAAAEAPAALAAIGDGCDREASTDVGASPRMASE